VNQLRRRMENQTKYPENEVKEFTRGGDDCGMSGVMVVSSVDAMMLSVLIMY
jgi:hypothetical protein